MCGFAAIFSIHNFPSDAPKRIRRMTDAMAHRGPDAEGEYVATPVALGHRRLSIIDLSPLGAQPMWDASGRYGVVFNGEIYNYQQLRAELGAYPFRLGPALGAYPFRSQSDTEVLLAGFAVWGEGLFARLNGMFAFALYDKITQELWLARDRFGIKPLYYHWQDGRLLAASELRALLATGLVAPKWDAGAVTGYLQNGAVHGPQSIVAGVREVPAGSFARVNASGFSVKPYHRLADGPTEPVAEAPEKVPGKVLNLFRQAVERQLVSDVPLGAFLSGGIDSSAIVALMSEVSEQPPMTFSVGFEEAAFDETRYAQIVADHYRTQHQVIRLTARDCLDQLPAALAAMDTPSFDGINTYWVSKATRAAGVTVALSGLGGDELFAGYAPFKRYVDWQRQYARWPIPSGVRQAAGRRLQGLSNSPKVQRIGALLQIPEYRIDRVYPIFRGLFSEPALRRLLPPGAELYNPLAHNLSEQAEAIGRFPLLSQYSLAELNGYTREMLLKDTDQMSMASSLEVRVPFFDNDLVEYTLRVADSVKYPHTPKQLLVQALGHRLPPEVVNRPKMGFSLPWAQWLRGELRPFAQQRIDALSDRGIFQADTLQQYWKWFLQDKKDVLWSHIWLFVVLEHWIECND